MSVGVNQWGLELRREKNWLPKRDAGTKCEMEKTAGAVFSTVLTERGNFGGAS